jgi:hypothetical protein
MGSALTSAVAFACLVGVSWAGEARAEPSVSERATARQLFSEGVALEDAKDFAAALDRFQRVAAIKPTPQVRYNLGYCLARTGHLVEAADLLGPLADLSGDTAINALASLARGELTRLRPRIPRLVVNAPSRGEAVVTLDGSEVSPALLGTAMLVNPGPHTVALTRKTGGGHAEQRVVAVEGAAAPLMVPPLELPPEEPAAKPAAPTARPGGARASRLTLGYVMGGIGVAAIGVGSAFGLLTLSTWSAAKTSCGAACPAGSRGQDERSTAQTDSWVSNVGFVAGGAALGAAAILLLTAPAPTTPTTTTPAATRETKAFQLAPWVTASGSGVVIAGAW